MNATNDDVREQAPASFDDTAAAAFPGLRSPTTVSLAGVIGRNIAALLEREKKREQQSSFQKRLADGITAFAGSMNFVYVHLAIAGFRIAVNSGWVPRLPRFDPTFVILATAASVEAIFLSTFILISQNRMQAAADKRGELNLQVSLLAEHEVTRLVTSVTAIANQMNIPEARDPELEELARDIAPEKVLDAMEQMQKAQGATGKYQG